MDYFLDNIYDVLERKTKEIKELKSQQKLQIKVNTINHFNHIKLFKPGKFLPPTIYNEITTSTDYNKETHYRLPLHAPPNAPPNAPTHINIHLHGTENAKRRVSKNLEDALICFMMLYELSKRCNTRHYFEEIHIYLFLTPFKKSLPINQSSNHQLTTTLGAFHINSGLTLYNSDNGEILTYREEEWFKLLLHESIHLLGFDRQLIENVASETTLMQYFHRSQYINHNEAYTELLAQILQCVYISYKNANNVIKRKRKFLKYIHSEKAHSILQIQKILRHMKIKPIDFLNNTRNTNITNNTFISNYKEETNVFSYYILKTILLYNLSSLFSTIIPYDLCITKEHIHRIPSFIIRCFENKTNNLFRKHILDKSFLESSSISKKKKKTNSKKKTTISKKKKQNTSKKKTTSKTKKHHYSSKSLRMAYHGPINL